MWGNNFWLGQERSCYLLNDPPEINLVKSENRKMFENMTNIVSEIPVEYRMFYASHSSTAQFDADLFSKSILHVGLCFPKACGQTEAHTMAELIFEEKFRDDFLLKNLKFLGTKTLEIRKNFFNEPFVIMLM
jgi:hypothetical protein